ncbi:MAG TPA: histidine kinase [Ferruginibacter sp.]|nr:histidine kinase [Ferruginibacter sp.]
MITSGDTGIGKLITAALLLFWIPVCCQAQPAEEPTLRFSNISFQHLTTANGLSYGYINEMCMDQGGNLWLATGNGLNMFNGRTVTKYYVAEHPQLVSNNIRQVLCDDNNRIWVRTDKRNVVMIDELRRMHKVTIYDSGQLLATRAVFFSKTNGVVFFTTRGHYVFNAKADISCVDSLDNSLFAPMPVAGFDATALVSGAYRNGFKFDDDIFLYSKDTVMYLVDFSSRKLQQATSIPLGNLLLKWSKDTVLFCDVQSRKLLLMNIYTGTSTNLSTALKDQFGRPLQDIVVYARQLGPNKFIFSTQRSGMYMYNRKTGQLLNYRHNAADPSSISSNMVYNIAGGANGWVFVVTAPNGVSYFNSREVIGTQSVFRDAAGNIYDGYISAVATYDNNMYYLGTSNGIIQWNRNTNAAHFPSYTANGIALLENEDIQTLCFDSKGQLWVSTTTKGILVISKNTTLIRHFKNNSTAAGAIRLKRAYILQEDNQGYMWASGEMGLCRIDINNFSVDYLSNTALAQFENNFISPLFFSSPTDLWFGVTDGGVRHYNFTTNKLEAFTKETGLLSNYIFSIHKDAKGSMYFGTDLGVNVLYGNGYLKKITTKDGLLIPRAEALILGKDGSMWIGNDIGLARYNPADSSLQVFDERYGLSIYGYRVNAYYMNSAGEFVFGTPKGVQYFFPDDLLVKKIKLNALISGIESRAHLSGITRSETFSLASDDNNVTFHFTSVDYSSHLNTYYKYMLAGNDKDWLMITNQNTVHYGSLSPGTYTFKVQVSSNKKDWQPASNEVTIIIAKPYWKTWWFRLLGILLGIGIIAYVINYFRNKQKQKAQELETELVITYFASQINKHTDINSLLWDVAKNCISRLHFDDCVIYLLDKQRNVLVQQAAYGPKNPVAFDIKAPIEIPVGKGIVGAVALSGKPEIIHNTAEDKRYIVDDEARSSEITVPILLEGQVVAVIDSEHPRKNFFNDRHLKILTTIAALCAAQMQLVKAEEEKKQAEIELLRNKQKALESRLQSLRLQMNPHFLFNALNSVQQMILANEEMVATRYLSRFSKLLRAILVHSDKESVTLREELDILRLYVELESIRFKDAFDCSITCDDTIDTDEVKIPTLLVQPFVENAIWHGLMHKEGERKLRISFTEKGEWLQCVVEDNGIGREKARAIKGISPSGAKHQSKGIAVSVERLKAMKNSAGEEGNIVFTDLFAADGTAAGTRVEINFPIIN